METPRSPQIHKNIGGLHKSTGWKWGEKKLNCEKLVFCIKMQNGNGKNV